MTELGNKHECLACSTKFYDLGKSELICPKCGENQKELADAQGEAAGKQSPRKKKSTKAKKKAAAKKKAVKKVKTEQKDVGETPAKDADPETQDASQG